MGASALPLLRPSPPTSGHLSSGCNTSMTCPPSCVAMRHGPRRRGAVFPLLAGGEGNGLSKEAAAQPKGEEQVMGPGESTGTSASPGGVDGGGGQEPPRRRAASSGIRWRELLLDPDPENVLAVGLTGLLAWASVQVLWQLLFISLAILLAALKYSFIAALLLFILITLL
ncbi:hypothetical protein Taro_011821 [Colocasia esculenta]|uniref:Uncharacterized protein n=1 Tax=Colocasia esculenta TaxID=4460 RepID=A0A843U2D8_COLES|nr:hypothetical protein [Colocasia esculenta]